MAENSCKLGNHQIQEAVNAELNHLRRLGANANLAFASSNLGAYEALLIIILNAERGIPVYEAVANVRTPFSGPAGVINRLRSMRRLGLIEEMIGLKKSQVCLVPSDRLLADIYPVLSARHHGGLQK